MIVDVTLRRKIDVFLIFSYLHSSRVSSETLPRNDHCIYWLSLILYSICSFRYGKVSAQL